MTYHVLRAVCTAIVASAFATTAHAQASTPTAPVKPAAVVAPQPPTSPPPSTVAPARISGLQGAAVTAPAPVRPAGRASVSPDSVRPRPVPAPAITPLANPRQTNPPRTAATPARAASLSAPNAVAPAGATLRCKDGTYFSGPTSDALCADRGGVAVKTPVAVPPRPRG